MLKRNRHLLTVLLQRGLQQFKLFCAVAACIDMQIALFVKASCIALSYGNVFVKSVCLCLHGALYNAVDDSI